MKYRILAVGCILALLVSIVGCQLVEQVLPDRPVHTAESMKPQRLVTQIDVSLHPANEEFLRLYRSEETMHQLLTLLRDLQTSEEPETEPSLHDGQAFFTVTTTNPMGDARVYYLLGHRYLKVGTAPWCVIPPEQSMALNEFLEAHPSEEPSHSSYVEPTESAVTTEPVQTTAPVETQGQ